MSYYLQLCSVYMQIVIKNDGHSIDFFGFNVNF